MELTYDWKTFQTLFYPRKAPSQSGAVDPIHLVVDGAVVISAFSDNEDLSDWNGAPIEEMKKEFSHREWVVFDRKKVDTWLGEASDQSHFNDQIQFLRGATQPYFAASEKYRDLPYRVEGHFLLEAIGTWWQKVLPSSYGVYVRLDEGRGQSILLVIKRGRVDGFHVPDLSGLPRERQKNTGEMIRFLSENYLMPIQGFFLSTEEWQDWAQSENPWPKIFSALKSNHQKLAPFSWSLFSMIGSRACLGI